MRASATRAPLIRQRRLRLCDQVREVRVEAAAVAISPPPSGYVTTRFRSDVDKAVDQKRLVGSPSPPQGRLLKKKVRLDGQPSKRQRPRRVCISPIAGREVCAQLHRTMLAHQYPYRGQGIRHEGTGGALGGRHAFPPVSALLQRLGPAIDATVRCRRGLRPRRRCRQVPAIGIAFSDYLAVGAEKSPTDLPAFYLRRCRDGRKPQYRARHP